MKLSQYKKWRVLLHRVIVKEQAKRVQTHPVCLHAVEKFEKVGNTNTQNDYETTSSRLFKRISWK